MTARKAIKLNDAESTTMVLSKSSNLRFDKTPNGWKLIRHARFQAGTIVIEKPVLENGKPTFGSVVLQKTDGTKKWAGQTHAERALEMSDAIPASWQEFFLIFPGTVWQNGHKDKMLPCLYFNGDNWEFAFTCLNRKFDEADRLVCF